MLITLNPVADPACKNGEVKSKKKKIEGEKLKKLKN